MKLRALLVLLVLSLLAGFMTIPAAPMLICDMTGLPIAAAPAAPAAPSSCCTRRHHDALVRAQAERSLERTSCCHLRQSPPRTASPALLRDAPPLLAVLAAPVRLPEAERVQTLNTPPSALRPAPRGPPTRRLPSRAPPVLS